MTFQVCFDDYSGFLVMQDTGAEPRRKPVTVIEPEVSIRKLVRMTSFIRLCYFGSNSVNNFNINSLSDGQSGQRFHHLISQKTWSFCGFIFTL